MHESDSGLPAEAPASNHGNFESRTAVWRFRGAQGSIQAALERDLPLLRGTGIKVDQMAAVQELEKASQLPPVDRMRKPGNLASQSRGTDRFDTPGMRLYEWS